MRFEKGHKAATRQHILEAASKCFRSEGVSGAGISGIMGAAGLTNGAFYAHFDSKDALVREAVSSALAERQQSLEEKVEMGADLEEVIRSYLNQAHRADPACGCPSAALLPEIARQSEPTRTTYEHGLKCFVSTLAALLPEADSNRADRRATAIFGLMVGTLQLARAVPSIARAEQILEAGVEAALLLAGEPRE
ncbi:TetR/AcrR family transcriptional regulator [Paraburkholderia sp. BL10I2N1]|uniref:TetR/AcrR family transcriptional regulator n=1 Tax=Paraburkholderia sp. BL10I2N1 TaxID=1938796 RepID=UPI001061AE14|nr:TetR/AcrR family transcriptional regulator [Paraburkholderia sp. BL10I2N1]TDN63975.1 TetR family transcriptional regulator [Paraburkholderia sp. BL10I2N1]